MSKTGCFARLVSLIEHVVSVRYLLLYVDTLVPKSIRTYIPRGLCTAVYGTLSEWISLILAFLIRRRPNSVEREKQPVDPIFYQK